MKGLSNGKISSRDGTHPHAHYLETEGEKTAYFHDTLSLTLSCLPSRIFPTPSTSLSVSLGTAVGAKVEPSARKHVPQLVPHLVPPSVTANRRWRGELRSTQHPEGDAAKNHPVAGSDPVLPAVLRAKTSAGCGVAPGHGVVFAASLSECRAGCKSSRHRSVQP